MRYRTRIYNSGENYPRTLKTQLPADHRVDIEFNGFVVSLIETAKGEIAVNVSINEMRQPMGTWMVSSSNGAMTTGSVGERFYLSDDQQGRPRGSLAPPRARDRTGRFARESEDDRE